MKALLRQSCVWLQVESVSKRTYFSIMPPKRKAVQNTENKAKRARGETDLKFDLKWSDEGKQIGEIHPLLLLHSNTLAGTTKVAGFDIDSTLITTKSGRTFATGVNDWKWLFDCVPDKLRKLDKDGHRVVFFTNQAGIEKKKVDPKQFMAKMEAIVAELDIPVFVLAATGNNHFRKPSTVMWNYFVDNCNKGVKVDKSESVYVGDAAGRKKDWEPGKKKDFSCSDRMFAANIGIKFATPEEFFLGEKPAPFDWNSFDSKVYMKSAPKATSKEKYHAKETEVVLLVGPPASGKSTFAKRHLKPHGYEIVNRDTLGTQAKCAKAVEAALDSGKSVVVDNTNPSKAGRGDYIQIAKENGVPCRCFVLKTPLDMAHHLNFVRQNQTNGAVRRIPDVGYNVYKKNYEDPQKNEGFKEIKNIEFVPVFDSKKDEELFQQWT